MPWSGSKLLRKLKLRKSSSSSEHDACIGLPPPGPSVFKSSMQQAQTPTPESSSTRRSVVFRDNRLPDGSSAANSQQQQPQVIQRPRLSSYNGSLDYSVASAQVRSSPVPPSGRLPLSGPAIPSLASYPASYQSNRHGEYATLPMRGSLQRPLLTNLPDFSLEPAASRPPRSTYDTDIPSPDYPILPSSTSGSSNRDSGLDSDSRSSSGHKPPYSPTKRSVDYSQGWNYSQNGDPRMMPPEETMQSSRPVNADYSAHVRTMTPQQYGARQGGVCTNEDEEPRYRTWSRTSRTQRWDDLETFSVRDWSSASRDFCRRLPLPKTVSLVNVQRQQQQNDYPYRSRDYVAASLARDTLSSRGQDQRHCGSCLCLNSIRDDIGHYTSVGTNTETATSSASETLKSRSPAKRVQLAKTPLHSRKEQRSKRMSLEMTWEAVGSEDEVRGEEEEEEEVQHKEREREVDEPQRTVYRPAFKAPPLPVLSSSSGRTTPVQRPPSAASGPLRLPRSQPLKAPSRLPYRQLDDALGQRTDADEEEDHSQSFDPMRRGEAADERSATFGANFREYAPSPSNKRISPLAKEPEDRSFVRI